MSTFSRRGILKFFGSTSLFFSLPGITQEFIESKNLDLPENKKMINTNFNQGYLSIVQGPTSDTETLINLFVPRLKKYTYEIIDENGKLQTAKPYERIEGPLFYHIDKLKITNLDIKRIYTLSVKDGKTTVDKRQFRTLDLSKKVPNFALLSCMSDDNRFNQSIDPMWNRLENENMDFLILSGDIVYVDSFEFVERQKANNLDLWQRYVDSFKRIPLYHWKNLVPVFALWDDHDYGTNDGDRNFISRVEAGKLFRGIFGGIELKNSWKQGPKGVSSVLKAFGQKFFFMDDRSFRQPNKNQTESEPYGHWGKEQHDWLLEELATDNNPSWIFNGNQFFNGTALSFKEAFEQNHSAEFVTFLKQLEKINAPVVFGSGDVHLSEIMKIPMDRIGYETYEFTSSSMHSYTGTGWDNPMRLEGAYTIAFNFLVIKSSNEDGALSIEVKSLGLKSEPYFSKELVVKK